MRRRDFISLLGGAAAGVWPLIAQAQQPGRMRRVGMLFPSSASDPAWEGRIAAVKDSLRAAGWIEGQTVAFMIRGADGRAELLPALAAELIQAKVDVVVTQSEGPINAIRNASSTTPIVMGMIGDALGAGVIASLARPGGNVTGLTLAATETVVKRLQLVRDLSKDLVRVAALSNGNAPSHRLQVAAIEQAAPALGFVLQSFPNNTSAADVDRNLRAALDAKVQVLFTHDDPVVESHRERIVAFAMQHRLPVIAENRPMLMAGALMSYSAYTIDMWRRAGVYVDKILRGEKAADLPVERPSRFEFVLNLKTAKALGLEFPPTLLARADEVIE
jgi:putative ABC transport system substrate-binding protein